MSNLSTQGEIVVGLDIGTTKVCAVVGEIAEDGITILGVGSVPCRGLRKGIVSATSTGRSAPSRTRSRPPRRWPASRSAPSTPASPGATSARRASDGVAAIAGGEVTRADVERVLEGARAIPVDADRQILHVLPREYIVDTQDGIRDPIGMSGVRLGAKVNLVTAATSCVQNVIRCAERCGLVVADVVLEPLASSEAVLSDDEKRDRRRGRRHRRRHDRHPPLRRRRHRARERHPRRRQQHHERHRRGPPHADGRGRSPEAPLRLRARTHGRRTTRKSRSPASAARSRAARRAACSQRHHRAARRGDLRRRPQAHRGHRAARAALGRRRPHGRRGAPRRDDRARRGNPRHAGPHRLPHRRARDHAARSRPAVRDRRGARALRRAGDRRGGRARGGRRRTR